MKVRLTRYPTGCLNGLGFLVSKDRSLFTGALYVRFQVTLLMWTWNLTLTQEPPVRNASILRYESDQEAFHE